VFRSFADRIGTIPDPTVPIVLVLAVLVGLLVAANLAAVIPARRASVVPAARQLRGE
jgi:ABC-type lipoprotein release transport system permease subunit